MNADMQDIKSLLGQSLTHRYLTERFLQFIDKHHIQGVLSSLSRITEEDAVELFQQRLGYVLNDRTRLRMVTVLMDFLCECECLKKEGKFYVLNDRKDPDLKLSGDESGMVREMFKGQAGFFDRCVAYADKFLRGSSPLFSFDGSTTLIWEAFLGNAEFSFARGVLINLLFSGRTGNARVLDLCYGPGFGILQMQERSPEIEVTALDFKDIFIEQARGRIRNPESVQWINATLWEGFGSPLPFNNGSFDIVFFACADPYIPYELRQYVYRDIFRVLRKGGSLGILSHSYPDAGLQYVKDSWVRRGILCHDFFEGVCKGWNGFHDAGESINLFEAVGFIIDTVMLNASVWKIDKP
ncbi:MAG: class I SAM-dependent methyltransferase [Nitrospiraceae bacterium]|nr:MAG: class I SAM-dependent methyltransferase [Nitrospiraceae bacterium]